MIFSLLRKKINKQIVKNKEDIIKVVDLFKNNINEETITNIFNHSTKILKLYLTINKKT